MPVVQFVELDGLGDAADIGSFDLDPRFVVPGPMTAGTITATRMPTMTTTIMISISVMPLDAFLITLLVLDVTTVFTLCTNRFMPMMGTRIASTIISTMPAMNSSING